MGEEKLVAYLKKELDKGISRERVSEALIGAGYPKERIDEAFLEYDNEFPKTEDPVEDHEDHHLLEERDDEPTHKRHTHLWPALLVIALIVLAGGAWFAWNHFEFGTPISMPEPEKEIVSTTNLATNKLLNYKNQCEAATNNAIDMCNDVMKRPNSACDKQKVQTDKDKCQDAVHFANALQAQDATICQNIKSTTPKKRCRQILLGQIEGDCDTLRDASQKAICFALTTNDHGYCVNLEVDIRESLYACKVYERSS